MKQLNFTPELYHYAESISLSEDPVLKALRESTAHLSLAVMQSPPMQAQYLQFLLQTLQAKRVLELGTYTGYSTLAMALALPDNGEIITCDINAEWTKYGHPFWEQAKQSHKISLVLSPAITLLEELATEPPLKKFDFVFIDADKTNYVNYYEYALKLIQPNGIIAIDNVLWNGKVIQSSETDAQTREIRRLNELIKQDTRVEKSLLPMGDGLFLIKLKQ